MKRKHLIGGLILSAFMSLGAVVAFNSAKNEDKPVEAAATCWTAGSTIFYDAPDWWHDNGAWSAAYFFAGSETGDYWQAMSYNAFTNNDDIYCCEVPAGGWTKVIFVRMASGKSIDDHWGGKYYNQTNDLSFTDGTDTFTSSDGSNGTWSLLSSKYSWQVAYGVGSDWSTTYTHSLSYKNDKDGAQFYTTSLTLNNTHQLQIKRVSPEGWFGSQYFEDGGAVGSYLTKGSGNNNVTVSNGGTFEFYVKMKNCSVWTQVSSATEADTWASGFVTGVGCAAPYNTAPANWSTYSGTYAGLTKGAKNIFYETTGSNVPSASNVEKAVFIYDMCVSKYTSCAADPFMTDGEGKPRGSAYTPSLIVINNSNSGVIIGVSVVAIISISAIGGYFFLRKKKEN